MPIQITAPIATAVAAPPQLRINLPVLLMLMTWFLLAACALRGRCQGPVVIERVAATSSAAGTWRRGGGGRVAGAAHSGGSVVSRRPRVAAPCTHAVGRRTRGARARRASTRPAPAVSPREG